MNSGIHTAVSGLKAQMNALDIISNNLANANTVGFKEEKPFFTVLNATMNANNGSDITAVTNNHSILSGAAINPADGSLLATGRDLDVALTGDGFLTVETPRGIRYTRNGSLILNSSSVLCTSEGLPVLGEKGPIVIGPGKLDINQQGEVFAGGARVGRLRLAAFDRTAMLAREGSSLVAPGPGVVPRTTDGVTLRQGYLEQSNVNAMASVVGLIGVMRQFESIQKSLNVLVNDIDSKSIEKLSR